MTANAPFGIIDIAVHAATCYVDQCELAAHLGIDDGKLLVGLGLREASACAANEDPVSLAMNAVAKILRKHNLVPGDIRRLEVGTESNWDGSKSMKSYLMDLFDGEESILGCDSVSGCYGGTNALFNAIAWLESSFYTGGYALVVCADMAIYKEEGLIPLAGAAACAILVGPNPVLVLKSTAVQHCFGNTADFMKPWSLHPYPVISGKASVSIYSDAFEKMYRRSGIDHTFYEHVAFHTPYPRLPEKCCLAVSIPIEKVKHSLAWPRKIGNSYTASLYVSLSSLLANGDVSVGDRILMYSFGSGFASSLFTLEKIRPGMEGDAYGVLENRVRVSPATFVDLMDSNSRAEKVAEHMVLSSAYYLTKIDDNFRTYAFLEK